MSYENKEGRIAKINCDGSLFVLGFTPNGNQLKGCYTETI